MLCLSSGAGAGAVSKAGRVVVGTSRRCFARSGFHKTTTAEICAEAGMSPGNLFHYFKNKNAIIEAIVEQDRNEAKEFYEKASQAEDLFEELYKLMEKVLVLRAHRHPLHPSSPQSNY